MCTGLFGGIERLQELNFVDPSRDYVCFTDDPNLKSKSWRVVLTEPLFPGDPARSVRNFKFLGHPVFDYYEKRLWVDNKIALLEPPDAIMAYLDSDYDLAACPHDHRESLSAEFKAVRAGRKDHPFKIREFENYLNFFSPHLLAEPIYEMAIIVSRRTTAVARLMREWSNLVARFSARDQLSFTLALERSRARLFSLPFTVSGSPHHRYVPGHDLGRSGGLRSHFEPRPSQILWDVFQTSELVRRARREVQQLRAQPLYRRLGFKRL